MARLVNKPTPLSEPIYDFMGKQIKIGSKIVYASLLGRSAKLTLGEVLEINEPKQHTYSSYKVSLKVQPIKDSLGGEWRFKEWDSASQQHVEKEANPVYLKFTDRLMVLDA